MGSKGHPTVLNVSPRDPLACPRAYLRGHTGWRGLDGLPEASEGQSVGTEDQPVGSEG